MKWHKPLRQLIQQDIHKLEYDAAAQYKFHFLLAWMWFLMMPLMAVVFWPHKLSDVVPLLIFEVSLWANFATHFGAMSAALAAKK